MGVNENEGGTANMDTRETSGWISLSESIARKK